MTRILTLAYGAVCYAIFFGTFLYLVGFLGGFGVPKTIDSGAAGSLGAALAVDTALLLLFGLQHSVMARPGFKRAWTRVVPKAAERSTYVLATSLVLILTFWLWRPIPASVWHVDASAARTALFAFYFAGVGLVLYATFLIDHFDLFGLRQVVLHFRRRPYTHRRFATPSLYRWIRHPLYVGWFLTFWMTPEMSVGHLLFAALNTLYIRIAIHFEERDLERFLGDDYRRWRERTPMFVPRVGRRGAQQPVSRPAEVR